MVQGKHTLADIVCNCKMRSVIALDSIASLLRLKDVTNTCICMQHSLERLMSRILPCHGRNVNAEDFIRVFVVNCV